MQVNELEARKQITEKRRFYRVSRRLVVAISVMLLITIIFLLEYQYMLSYHFYAKNQIEDNVDLTVALIGQEKEYCLSKVSIMAAPYSLSMFIGNNSLMEYQMDIVGIDFLIDGVRYGISYKQKIKVAPNSVASCNIDNIAIALESAPEIVLIVHTSKGDEYSVTIPRAKYETSGLRFWIQAAGV